eukprot:m.15956 g.15956  ORF g.15956 m.15956 type:complete len:517 (+) comp5540_c0_seq1:417-1967(+)
MQFHRDELEAALKVLSAIENHSTKWILEAQVDGTKDEKERKMLVGKVFNQSKSCFDKHLGNHKSHRARKRQNDHELVKTCGLRKRRMGRLANAGVHHLLIECASPTNTLKGEQKENKQEQTPTIKETPTVSSPKLLAVSRSCYVCKKVYRELHSYYDQLCKECGDVNYTKRVQPIPLEPGQISLVTGGRVKIGYHIALKLLRAKQGGNVIVTTRFPNDAAARYSLETDYPEWKHKLVIYGLDFRDVSAVERFGKFLAHSLPRLDILINNAAQTIRRPTEYYRHLWKKEFLRGKQWDTVKQFDVAHINGGYTGSMSVLLSSVPVDTSDVKAITNGHQAFPPGQYDVDHQQIDDRPHHSWLQRLHEVSTVELMETLCINSAAPFILCGALRDLMSQGKYSFVINVSSMEGSFTRPRGKKTAHPHTNGAKAFLDMMTYTAAADYATSGIYLNAVDTGWVTNENPRPQASSFVTPIDEVDGAARVLDPIVMALDTKRLQYGYFYKDYAPIDTRLPSHHTE